MAEAPDDAGAWASLARSQRDLGELEDAVASFRRAADLEPGSFAVLDDLVNTARWICDWDTAGVAATQALGAGLVRTGTHRAPLAPFTALKLQLDPVVQKEITVRFVETWPGPARRSWPRARTHGRLRIGYFSGDMANHAVMHLGHQIFERHDRERFEVYGYSTGPDDGSRMRQYLQGAFDKFVDLFGRSDRAALAAIRADEIDVLIDLSGHTHHGRLPLLAYRPAPVQVHYLGYPGTTGAPFVDWFITDAVASPVGSRFHFTERLAYLPHTYQVNYPLDRNTPPRVDRTDFGLPAQGTVFASFNASYKMDAQSFSTWMRILRRVPGSVLWLLRSNRFMEARLRRQACAAGVESSRLVFADRVRRSDHLTRHRLVQVALDPLIVSGHTTSSDALRCGVPLVTRPHRAFVSRVPASLLTGIGAPDLICTDIDSYIETAVAMGSNPGLLERATHQVRRGVRDSPVFDTGRQVRALERLYSTMWDLHLRNDTRSIIRMSPRDM